MSDNSKHGDDHGATTIHASKGGGGAGKWLLGALAAVVIAGGGYAAYKTFSPGQNNDSQLAYNDEQYGEDDPLRAGPLDPEDNLTAESASTDDSTASTASDEPRPARRSRASERRTAEVPEATIGLTPISATTEYNDEDEEVVVTAPPRPVWARVPTEQRLAMYYPERARARGREGEASLSCMVQGNGSLDCERVQETSASFGAAAMNVSRTLRHAPVRADGADATGTPVNLRVVFRMEENERQRYASR